MRINRSLQLLVACLIAMCAAGFILLMLPPHGDLAITPDSISYLAAAHNLANGHGLSLFNFSLFDPRYVPYTTWPPLYPLALATGIKPEWIQVLAVGGIAALTCLLLARRAKYPSYIACGLALIVTLPWPILLDASYVWSEPLALFWVFAAIVALSAVGIEGASDSRRDIWYWLAAIFAIVMAIYSRYAAILFVPGVMLALLRAPIPWRKRVTLIIATPFTVSFFLTPLFIHNLMSSDHLSGGMRIHSHMTLVSLLSSQFLYYGWVFAINRMTQTLLVVFVISLLLGAALYWKDSRSMGAVVDDSTVLSVKWLGWIAGSLFVTYFFGIAFLRAWKTFDWGPRILSPGMPVLLLALAAWMQVMRKSARLRWEKIVLAIPFLGMLSLATVTSFQLGSYVHHDWRATGTPHWPQSPVQTYTDLHPVPLPNVKGILLCDRPEEINYVTGWTTRQIPVGSRSREMLLRIADKASGVVINSREAGRLAKKLRGIVAHPRILKLGGVSLLVWK